MRRASALPHFRPERGHRIDPGQEKDFEISRAQCGAEPGWRETMREVPVVASAEARRAPHAQCQYAIGNEYPRELVERTRAIRKRHVLQNVGTVNRLDARRAERQRRRGRRAQRRPATISC